MAPHAVAAWRPVGDVHTLPNGCPSVPSPWSYCTNVHAGRTVAEVEAGLDRYTVAVRDRFGGPLAVGLCLARPARADGMTVY